MKKVFVDTVNDVRRIVAMHYLSWALDLLPTKEERHELAVILKSYFDAKLEDQRYEGKI